MKLEFNSKELYEIKESMHLKLSTGFQNLVTIKTILRSKPDMLNDWIKMFNKEMSLIKGIIEKIDKIDNE